ncbi:DJ-1 family glyoxalase III [uncultured Ilyobacter sp.]|uniref:DJ-1 family glyoxalase III n=1 Tax=uncultured Ilyobacter sp. TaxID=544433 RepID=UPI0029C0840D|nr:DJ-1 family glyoxalase III [uncultured Ilyobacter sp.]
MKKVYLLLAEGFETIEALAPVDILRRCGIEVVTLSVGDSKKVVSSQNIPVEADKLLSSEDYLDGDMLILPGGSPGYENLGKSYKVIDLSREYLNSSEKFLGAICGAPSVLDEAGLLKGKKIICHYGVKDLIKDGILVDEKVIQDGNLITASGAGLGIDFGLKLAEVLVGPEKVEDVKKKMTII